MREAAQAPPSFEIFVFVCTSAPASIADKMVSAGGTPVAMLAKQQFSLHKIQWASRPSLMYATSHPMLIANIDTFAGGARGTEDCSERFACITWSSRVFANKSQPESVCFTSCPMLAPTTNTSIRDRTKRVKDAKSEAQKEIDEYRKQKDEEFKKYEKEVCCRHHNWSVDGIGH